MQSPAADHHLNQSEPSETLSRSNRNAIVVGLYGLPGSGKTYLLNQLKQKLGEVHFAFYEGSTVIASIVPGGLDVFQTMEEEQKAHWRQRAIESIGRSHADGERVAVVAGHFMFWPKEQEVGQSVCTQADLGTFTHILYLDVPAGVIADRRRNDNERSRPSLSAAHLSKWQQEEKQELRRLCREHGILFSLVSPDSMLLNNISRLLLDFERHTETYNTSRAKTELNKALVNEQGPLGTVLAIDADKTLAAEDTGALFWKRYFDLRRLEGETCPLKTLFSSPLAYSYTAFRQAMLQYEEVDDPEFDTLCGDVTSEVTIHPEFLCLLRLVAEHKSISALVVTCGLRRVWEKVLERENLSKSVKIIGAGRIEDGFVVTAAVKGALVSHMQNVHHAKVWAFGDSPLDLDMLSKAYRAIVVVGEEQTRSKSMDAALKNAIRSGLQAKQALLPSHSSPRLDTAKLPIVSLTEPEFVHSLLGTQSTHEGLEVLYATDTNAAKVLATPTRDAAVAGPGLREAHRRVGWYLAIEYLADVIGLEQAPIEHVLGRQTRGYQLFHEQQTTIVALIRGGEPMAYGVNDAFPSAMFVHANKAKNIKPHHLEGQLTVVLVDSVVNTGKTIVEFVERVRKLHATIRIVVVAGVVQAQCVRGSSLRTLVPHGKLHLIALRLSETKFTGSGTTDTGNRLFNTTHLS